jgi:hemerythrin
MMPAEVRANPLSDPKPVAATTAADINGTLADRSPATAASPAWSRAWHPAQGPGRQQAWPLTWRDSYKLDIAPLDADHQEMVRLINRLADAGDPMPLPRRLDDLIAHLRRHFKVEQAFLQQIDYPAADRHTREHAIQMAEFVDLSRHLVHSTARVLDQSELAAIKHWFFNHVVAEDKRFAAYYRDVICGAVEAAS